VSKNNNNSNITLATGVNDKLTVNSKDVVFGNGTQNNNFTVHSQNVVLCDGDNSNITVATGVNDKLNVNSKDVVFGNGTQNNNFTVHSQNVVLCDGNNSNITVATGVNDKLTVKSNNIILGDGNTGNNFTLRSDNVFLCDRDGSDITVATGVNDKLTVKTNDIILGSANSDHLTVNSKLIDLCSQNDSIINVSSNNDKSQITVGTSVDDKLTVNSKEIILGKEGVNGNLKINYCSTFNKDLIINGNLTINNGSVTSVISNTVLETIRINDALIVLNPNGTSSDNQNYPIGLISRTSDGTSIDGNVTITSANGNSLLSGLVMYKGSSENADFGSSPNPNPLNEKGKSQWYLFDTNQTLNGVPSMANAVGCELYVGSVCCSSDERLKKDIHNIENSLDHIDQLNGVYYKWKDNRCGGKQEVGVIAQDIQRQFPELVNTDKDGFLAVDYARLSGVLIEGVKELRRENKELRELVNELLQEVRNKKEEPKEEAKEQVKEEPKKKRAYKRKTVV